MPQGRPRPGQGGPEEAGPPSARIFFEASVSLAPPAWPRPFAVSIGENAPANKDVPFPVLRCLDLLLNPVVWVVEGRCLAMPVVLLPMEVSWVGVGRGRFHHRCYHGEGRGTNGQQGGGSDDPIVFMTRVLWVFQRRVRSKGFWCGTILHRSGRSAPQPSPLWLARAQ